MKRNNMQSVIHQLMEKERLEILKKLKKTKIDYDQILKTVPIKEIEKYLRKLKIENIQK